MLHLVLHKYICLVVELLGHDAANHRFYSLRLFYIILLGNFPHLLFCTPPAQEHTGRGNYHSLRMRILEAKTQETVVCFTSFENVFQTLSVLQILNKSFNDS